MIEKTCLVCKKKYKCEGECKIKDRIDKTIACCCGDCIVSPTNFGSVEAYKKRLIVENTTRAFCHSRFGIPKEKVVFT